MKYYHDQHIGVYENAISDEWCDKVISHFQQNQTKTFHRQTPDQIASGIRDKQIFLEDENLLNGFHSSFSKVFDLYLYKYPNMLRPLIIEEFKLQKTLPTEGYHPFHVEQGPGKVFRRVAVYTVYLNDVEEGGETEFLYQLKRVKPKKGTICIFPAGYTHVHRGNTPFSGEKYIMTGWLVLAEETQEEVGS